MAPASSAQKSAISQQFMQLTGTPERVAQRVRHYSNRHGCGTRIFVLPFIGPLPFHGSVCGLLSSLVGAGTGKRVVCCLAVRCDGASGLYPWSRLSVPGRAGGFGGIRGRARLTASPQPLHLRGRSKCQGAKSRADSHSALILLRKQREKRDGWVSTANFLTHSF